MAISGRRSCGPSCGESCATFTVGVRNENETASASVPPVADFVPAGMVTV
jgi:hypothetical protein